jgi:hypothetical protein
VQCVLDSADHMGTSVLQHLDTQHKHAGTVGDGM